MPARCSFAASVDGNIVCFDAAGSPSVLATVSRSRRRGTLQRRSGLSCPAPSHPAQNKARSAPGLSTQTQLSLVPIKLAGSRGSSWPRSVIHSLIGRMGVRTEWHQRKDGIVKSLAVHRLRYTKGHSAFRKCQVDASQSSGAVSMTTCRDPYRRHTGRRATS